MEHELDQEQPGFQQALTSLMESASRVKVYGWSRARQEPFVVDLIKKHNYAIEAYTILNCAKLKPAQKRQ